MAFFNASSGNDIYVGDSDDDRIDYRDPGGDPAGPIFQGLYLDLAAGIVTDGWGGSDTLVSIERIRGTDLGDTMLGDGLRNRLQGEGGDDTLEGRGGNDNLSGGGGDDTLIGGEGGDFLEPGTGTDTIMGGARGPNGEWNELVYVFDYFYSGASGSITVNFSSEFGGTVNDYAGDTDTFSDIDRVIGTMGNDTFNGTTGTQIFTGFAGNDTFNGGGGDRDRVDYSPADWDPALGAFQGVTADLATQTATDPFGGTDTLLNIEQIRGTERDDTLAGNNGANRLEGRGGNDTLTGRGGNDDLNGGLGDDTLNGGAGGDFIQPGGGNDTIVGGGASRDEFWDELVYAYDSFYGGYSGGVTVTFSSELDGTATDFAGGTDTFTGIERVWGSGAADTFIGSTGEQIFTGFAGNDSFDGGDGNNDSVDYRQEGDATELGAFRGIDVDLAAGIGIDPFGGTDSFVNIERVRGTNRDDLISGDDLSNDLYGYGGNDLLWGNTIDGVFNEAAFQAFRFYQATLDRAPDVKGLLDWTNGLLNGLPVMTAISGFVNSAEFQVKYGATSNTQFVNLLYNNVLDRAPDAKGLNDWLTGLANGLSREAVVLGFADSPEFIQKTSTDFLPFSSDVLAANFSADVFRLYQATLDRAPDAAGLGDWVGALGKGASKLDIVRGFTSSPEFQAKYGALNDGQFVNLLYNNVLDRAPDAKGFADWTNGLAAGLIREAVVLGFADSPEFVAKTDPDVFDYMRGSAANDLADWLEGGAGDDQLVGGLGDDTFRFIQGEGGSDVVVDLEPWDFVRLEGFGYSTAGDVLTHMDEVASAGSSGTVFEDQGQSIFFIGAALSDFSDDTFQFA